MLGWLRKLLTDADSVEDRLRAELRSAAEREDWLSRRLHVVEQRLDAADGAIRELGHRWSAPCSTGQAAGRV